LGTNQGPARGTAIPSEGSAPNDLIIFHWTHLLEVLVTLNIAALGTKFPAHELLEDTLKPYPNCNTIWVKTLEMFKVGHDEVRTLN
jgi:hypothetical protein